MGGTDLRPWLTLLGLFGLTAGFIAYVIAPASVLHLFAEDFGIDRSTASGAISAVFLSWAVLQIPAGYIVDRIDNRLLVAIGAGGFLLAVGLGHLTTTYLPYLGTRLLAGAAVVFIFTGGINILHRVLPESRRAFGLSLFIAAPPFGIAVAQAVTPIVTGTAGWRTALLLYAGLGTGGTLVFLLAQRQPVRPTGSVTIGQFLGALREPSILLVSVASCCTYAIWTFLNTWMPSYGTDVLGIELAAAGAATALVPVGGILSRPGGGWLSDAIGRRPRPVITASFVSSIALLLLLSQASSPTTFAILLALTGAGVNLSVGLYLVYVTDLAITATQGTSLAVLITFSQVGNLVAPIVGGWLIAGISWTAGFGFAVALALAGLTTVALAPAVS